MSMHTVKERVYRNPDGNIVGESELEGGATLVAAPGDELTSDKAAELGLTRQRASASRSGADAATVVAMQAEIDALRDQLSHAERGEKEATAEADQQRALANALQLSQAGDDATSDQEAVAAESETTAAKSAAAAEAEQNPPAPKGGRRAANKQRGTAANK